MIFKYTRIYVMEPVTLIYNKLIPTSHLNIILIIGVLDFYILGIGITIPF